MTNVLAVAEYCESHSKGIESFHFIFKTSKCCPESRKDFFDSAAVNEAFVYSTKSTYQRTRKFYGRHSRARCCGHLKSPRNKKPPEGGLSVVLKVRAYVDTAHVSTDSVNNLLTRPDVSCNRSHGHTSTQTRASQAYADIRLTRRKVEAGSLSGPYFGGLLTIDVYNDIAPRPQGPGVPHHDQRSAIGIRRGLERIELVDWYRLSLLNRCGLCSTSRQQRQSYHSNQNSHVIPHSESAKSNI